MPISASAGITFSASPARKRPTVTTADSAGSTLRATTVCRLVTMAAAATSGSTDRCGRAAWPPTPRILT